MHLQGPNQTTQLLTCMGYLPIQATHPTYQLTYLNYLMQLPRLSSYQPTSYSPRLPIYLNISLPIYPPTYPPPHLGYLPTQTTYLGSSSHKVRNMDQGLNQFHLIECKRFLQFGPLSFGSSKVAVPSWNPATSFAKLAIQVQLEPLYRYL